MNNSRNSKMVRYQEYVAGWLDSSIHEFLQVVPGNSKSLAYAFITCLDSNLDPASQLRKSPQLKALNSAIKPYKRGLLVPTSQLQQADANDQIFFGFDEVWFFPRQLMEPKPDSAWLVGPARIDQIKLDALGNWMARSSCSLALGDGEGLNFIVKAQGVVKWLLAHSLTQSQSSLMPLATADSA